jgi:PPK2 family polyphosphate:nucleotide phosphotransferase
MPHAIVFDDPGAKVRLDSISTRPPPKMTKAKAKARFEAINEELFELQDLLWGAKTHSVLVILQGRDAAGKDGAVKHVVGALNPRGVKVTSFGVPSVEEREHDFLWRVHEVAPRLGEFAIFNRSHYEDVLIVRVHELVKKALWKTRYESINAFEAVLAEHGCIVLKYFLHISKEEQEERLLAREENPAVAWKINVDDWKQREEWDEFTEAYEDAISRCAAPHAPWMVVPSDAKWFRNLALAESLLTALRPYRKQWLQTLEKVGRLRRTEVEAWRAEHAAGATGDDIERAQLPEPRPSDKRKRVVRDSGRAAAEGSGT